MKNRNSFVTPDRLWNRYFILSIVLGLLTQSASQMVTTLITKYALNLGAELTLAATISAAMSFVALICRPFSGIITDRLNRKVIMIISVAVTAISVISYAVFPNIASLIIFRIIHGMAFAFMGVATTAFGTTYIPDKSLAEGVSYLSIGSVLASAVGPSIGLSISKIYGYNAVFYITAVILAASLMIIFILPYRKEKNDSKIKLSFSSLIEPRAIMLSLILVLFSAGNGLMNTYAAILGEERGIPDIALFFAAYSIATFLSRPFVGKLLEKKGLTFVIIPALFFGAAAMGLISIANATWMFIAAGLLKALGQGSSTSSVNAYSIKLLGKERSGVIGSTYYIGQDIGNAAAPIIGSYIVKNYGFTFLFGSYAVLLLAGGILFYLIHLALEKKYMD